MLHDPYNFDFLTMTDGFKKYSNYLKTARGSVTYKSLLYMAKQTGVELPEPYRHAYDLHTGFEAIRPIRPKRPKGQTVKNDQKTEKTAKNGFLGNEWPNGHLAFLAFTEGYTFSDKIAPTDWPSLCRGILDSQTDTVGHDKMMLGALYIISGLPQRSYYGGLASKKSDPLSCPRPNVLATYGIARQRIGAHGACRNFVMQKRYEGIRPPGRCSEAAPRLLRGCSEVALMFL